MCDSSKELRGGQPIQKSRDRKIKTPIIPASTVSRSLVQTIKILIISKLKIVLQWIFYVMHPSLDCIYMYQRPCKLLINGYSHQRKKTRVAMPCSGLQAKFSDWYETIWKKWKQKNNLPDLQENLKRKTRMPCCAVAFKPSTCIPVVAYQPKKSEKQGVAVVPGLVRLTNWVLWLSG